MRNPLSRNRNSVDWEAIGGLVAVVVVAAVIIGAVWYANLPTCYGVEPDGEVEQLHPCPPGWTDGEKRNIGEDEFESRESGR